MKEKPCLSCNIDHHNDDAVLLFPLQSSHTLMEILLDFVIWSLTALILIHIILVIVRHYLQCVAAAVTNIFMSKINGLPIFKRLCPKHQGPGI